MRKLTRSILATTAVVGLLAIPVAGAGADDHTATQEVTGTVNPTVTIKTDPPATAPLGTLPATNKSVGSITVNANDAYTLTVVSQDHEKMTLWDAETETYDATVSLQSNMTMVSAATAGNGSGTALGTPALITKTTPAPIGVNAFAAGGLLTSTDTYALTVSQPATALDAAGNYRMVLVYTAALGV